MYALKKFEYLVRDHHFTLLTDHQNLIYIDKETSQKVKRWKLAIQGYDFDIHHIPGRLNVVADGFSRIQTGKEDRLLHLIETSPTAPKGVQEVTRRLASLLDTQVDTLLWMEEYKIPSECEIDISRHHNEMVGHHGVQRTIERLVQERNNLAERAKGDSSVKPPRPWTDLRVHVHRFVKRCACCQKMSYLKVPITTHKYTVTAAAPFTRINIDTIGPLPLSEKGNNRILVIIDCFSRWVTLYPLRDSTMESARQALLWHMGQWTTPLEVVHDGGPEFGNKGVEELLEMCGVRNVKTLAYSKEENSLVERANKEVMRHMRNLLFRSNVTMRWEDHLGTIMKIMNHQKRGTFFPSPASLLFGDRFRDDELFFLPPHKGDVDEAHLLLSAWASDMIMQQATIYEWARKIQFEKDQSHLMQQGAQVTTYEVGDYVLANYHSTDGVVTHRGPPSKFLPRLRGPLKVVAREGDTYTVRSLVTKRDEEIHVKELRKFIHSGNEQDLFSIALRDHQDRFVIEQILDHEGNLSRKRDLRFKVRWQGYAADEDSWVEYSELRDSGALHEYLLSKPDRKFHRLVPRKFFKGNEYAPDDD